MDGTLDKHIVDEVEIGRVHRNRVERRGPLSKCEFMDDCPVFRIHEVDQLVEIWLVGGKARDRFGGDNTAEEVLASAMNAFSNRSSTSPSISG
jgi:hypothetical protein